MYTHILCRAGVELNIYEFLSRVFGGGSSTAAVCDVIIYLATPGIVFHPVSGGRAQTSLPCGSVQLRTASGTPALSTSKWH